MANNLVDPPDRARCTARANRTGKRCRRAAISGGRVCPTHGGRAPQVKQRAGQRAALQRAAELLGPDVTADPAKVLVAAVRSAAALLGAAEAALLAEEPDANALHQLGEAALLAGRLSKLALDSGIEQRLARQAEEAGALVGALITRTINDLELGPDVAAQAFRLIRREVEADRVALGPYGNLSVAELDVEIARVVRALDEHDQADAIAGFPSRMAGAVDAALSALDLSDADQEKALAAVEAFLARDAAEREERARTRHERAGIWTRPAASNGNERGRRGP
jgi:hypothetical protein